MAKKYRNMLEPPPGYDRCSPREKAKIGYGIQIHASMERGKQHQLAMRAELGKTDLFFLLVYVLRGNPFFDNDWAFARCREVQANPDGYIDLWAREHLKSSIITFALTIQDLLNDPERTFGIFSFTRPIAKAFLRKIKLEFEQNNDLKILYPDVCWMNPEKESPKWSEDDGLLLKRKGNYAEMSVEAWGLTDGMPTSKHFWCRLYDDIVTDKSVNTHEMIQKTTSAFSLSDNLGKDGGVCRVVGTPYSDTDTYNWIIENQVAIPRIHPATVDGEIDSELVYFSPEYYAKKRRGQTTYNFNCQILMRPKLEDAAGFREEWWKTWPNTNHENLNLYIIVDPAKSKSKAADNTAMWLIGYGADENIYAVDFILDKLSLSEKADILFKWHRDYKISGTYYESVALQSDREHMEYRMGVENFRFEITDISPGRRSKKSRVNALEPRLRAGRIMFMPHCHHINYQGEKVDMILAFKNNEFKPWPLVSHDDGLDGLAYVEDIPFISPAPKKRRRPRKSNVVPFRPTGTSGVYGGY